MNRNRVAFLTLLTATWALLAVPALAATPYAITATNLTMPANDPPTTSGGITTTHLGSSQFTVTGVPSEGTLSISCQYAGPVTSAKIPQQCGIVGPGQVPIPAGETTFTGTVYFVPYSEGSIPSLARLRSLPRPANHLPATTLALAGALMLGFGFRRRTRRALFLSVFAIGTLVAATAITACGGTITTGMTPGTYPYTISAAFTGTDTNTIQTASTTVTLTVQ